MSFLIGLLSNPTVIAVLAGILGVLGFGFQQRRAGAKAERAKQEEREDRARDINDEIEDAISGRSAEENRRRLGKWSR